jgi:hypothetical protein
VRHITSRLGAAVGAVMILASASPPTARAQQPAARPRAAAQWLGRRAAAPQMLRWRMVHRPMATAWRRGYARGWMAGRHPMRAATWRGAYGRRYARGFARARLYSRFWERQRLGRMGTRWSL